MATIRNTPLARRAMVAKLRLRRRAQARIARVVRVNLGGLLSPTLSSAEGEGEAAASFRSLLNSGDFDNLSGALGTARPTFASAPARARERSQVAVAVRPAINRRQAAEKKVSALLRFPLAKAEASIPTAARAEIRDTQTAQP